MLSTAIIMFRESLEAALIITIILTATKGLRSRGFWVSAGILAGSVAAIVVAMFAQQLFQLAEGTGQELFNACVLLAATLMLGWHNVWMARHGRAMTVQMNGVGKAVSGGERHMSTLAVVVGLAVLREGAEVVLFLNGLFVSGTHSAQILLGSMIGLGGGVLAGVLLYFGLMRIPMRHFFAITSWIILLLAAGLAAQAAGFLTQAGLISPLVMPLWDTSALLSERSLAGQVLHSLVGYIARPSGMQVLVYAGTVLVIGLLMRQSRRTFKAFATAAWVSPLLMTSVLACLGFHGTAAASHIIYSPIVEAGETEIEFRGHSIDDDKKGVDGSSKYKLDFGRGVTDRWFTEIVLEYENPAQQDGELTAVEWEFASRLQWRRGPHFEPSIEVFAEQHELQAGPGFLGRARMGKKHAYVAWEVALLLGLTADTPDRTARFLLEFELY
jgi:high-affinity iron transporter